MFSDKLKELRRENKLSQEALAEKLGVSRQTVSKWENGEALPDTYNVVVLSNLFNISLDSLLKDKEIGNPSVSPIDSIGKKNKKSNLKKSLICLITGLLILSSMLILSKFIPSETTLITAGPGDEIVVFDEGETHTETLDKPSKTIVTTYDFSSFVSTYYLHWLVVLSFGLIVYGFSIPVFGRIRTKIQSRKRPGEQKASA